MSTTSAFACGRGTRPPSWLISRHGVTGEVVSRYGADGDGLSIYIDDPEGNMLELKGPPVGTA